jgi:uncharacterized protein (TIGR02217 family)
MPALPISMAKGLHKTPHFNTMFQKTVVNVNASASLQPYATWDFEFDMDAIQGNEASVSSVLAQFFGLLMACQGRNGLFLFTDPQDNTVSLANSGMLNVTPAANAPMGIKGDGSSTQFQLARSISGLAWDIIQNVNGAIIVQVNGVSTSGYTISSTGVVTFTTPPALNATLTWSGNYYYACRFSADTVDAARTYTCNSGTDLWNVTSIRFSSEFQ